MAFNFYNTPGFINDKCEADSELWREFQQTHPTDKLNLDKLIFEARFEDEITEADDLKDFIVYARKINYPIYNIEFQLPFL